MELVYYFNMTHVNVEIKARSNNVNKVREILKNKGADFKGIDHQIDTYFVVPNGRLKLREGNIENYLIHYERVEDKNSKTSKVTLSEVKENSNIKNVLLKALKLLAIVDKKREIYFIDNVKFHIDEVENLGSFIEIEAIDPDGLFGIEKITEQCAFYKNLFEVQESDLIDCSYSDLVMRNN